MTYNFTISFGSIVYCAPTTITQQCIQISRKMFEGIIWELLFDFLFTFLKLSGYGTKSGGLGIFFVCCIFFVFGIPIDSIKYFIIFINCLIFSYKSKCNFLRDLYAFNCFFQEISAKTTSFGKSRD